MAGNPTFVVSLPKEWALEPGMSMHLSPHEDRVVAVGSFEEIDPSDLTAAHIEQYGAAKRPLFEILGESKQDLNIQLCELEPTDLNGRRTEIDRNA